MMQNQQAPIPPNMQQNPNMQMQQNPNMQQYPNQPQMMAPPQIIVQSVAPVAVEQSGVCCKFDNMLHISMNLRMILDITAWSWLWITFTKFFGFGPGTAFFFAISFLTAYGLSGTFIMSFSSSEVCCGCFLCNCCCKDCCSTNAHKQGGFAFLLILRIIALAYAFQFVTIMEDLVTTDNSSAGNTVGFNGTLSELQGFIRFACALQFFAAFGLVFWSVALCQDKGPNAGLAAAVEVNVANPGVMKQQPM